MPVASSKASTSMTLSQDALDAARDAYDDWYDGLVGSKDAAIAAAIEAYLKEAVAELDKPAPSLPRLRAFLKGGDATEKSDLEGHPSAHVAQAPASAAGASPTPPRAPAAMPDGSAEAVAEGERERCINQLRKMSDRLDQTHTGPRGTLAAAIEALIAPRAPAAETAEREAERRYRYTTVDTWPERHAVTRERSAFIDGWQAREQLEWKPGDLRCEHCDNGAETGWGWCPWCGQILMPTRYGEMT
jgi:hypothetical protein